MQFKAYKVVSVLPDPINPDSLYLVRAGSGFDLYCSDSTGTIAHKINDVDTSNFAEIVSVPATASSSGTPGQIAYDTSYIYVCVSQDTWMRAGIATW